MAHKVFEFCGGVLDLRRGRGGGVTYISAFPECVWLWVTCTSGVFLVEMYKYPNECHLDFCGLMSVAAIIYDLFFKFSFSISHEGRLAGGDERHELNSI